MEAAEAVNLLKSALASERLRGARALRFAATSTQREDIESALALETDSWVCSALSRARDRLDGKALVPEAETEELREVSREVRAQATAEATTMLLHELRPLVGLLRLVARRELADYESTKTARSVDRITSFLRAIELLGMSASAPSWSEFNLSDLVANTVESELAEDEGPTVMVVGANPAYVVGDENLVRLALSQAVRNAIEAVGEREVLDRPTPTKDRTDESETVSHSAGKPTIGLSAQIAIAASLSPAAVVINWGITDRDYWIAVLDDGVGLPAGTERMFAMWTTRKRKSNHFGIGLPLALRAMATLPRNRRTPATSASRSRLRDQVAEAHGTSLDASALCGG